MSQVRRRMVFILPSMVMGGVSRMLLSLLKQADYDQYDIEVMLLRCEGELLSEIPPQVKVTQAPKAQKAESSRAHWSEFFKKYTGQTIFNSVKKLYHCWGSMLVRSSSVIPSAHYDIVVAFQDGLSTWYAVQYLCAKVMIAVIHTDFQKALYVPYNEKKIYQHFNRIFCTSVSAKESFVQAIPTFAPITEVILPNIIKQELQQLAASSTLRLFETGIHILTIARLSHEKGVDKIVYALAQLIKDKQDAHWSIIGDGIERLPLENLAQRLGCKNRLHLWGNLSNPYGLLRQCDLYVQPSNYESYCIALAEARAMGKAIVCCDFKSAHQQLGSSGGVICGGSWESLYQAVLNLVNAPECRNKYSLYQQEHWQDISCGVDLFWNYTNDSLGWM